MSSFSFRFVSCFLKQAYKSLLFISEIIDVFGRMALPMVIANGQ